MIKDRIIAIDGPSGSGKSTITKKLAMDLNLLYVDTGAMFRAIALVLDQNKINFLNDSKTEKFLSSIDFQYAPSADKLIVINNIDFTRSIRDHHVSKLASNISKNLVIRKYLLDIQRRVGKSALSIMEGRDIGTVVFPNSFCKIFLTASFEARANRRLLQLNKQGDNSLNFETILNDIKERDFQDMNREIAPLKQADDAILVDTSDLNFDQVIDQVKNIIISQLKNHNINI